MKSDVRKNTTYLIPFIVIFLFAVPFGQAQDDEQLTGKLAEMKKVLSSGKYTFEAERILPTSGPTRVLTTRYSMEVTDSTAKGDFPYYGIAYSNVDAETDQSITFNGVMEEYSLNVKEDKGKIMIKFNIVEENMLYQFSLNVSKSGSALLHVTPQNRQSISYLGDIKEPQEEWW
jgi:hypothetical protein